MILPLTVIVVMFNDFPVQVCLSDKQAEDWIKEDKKTPRSDHTHFTHYHKHTFVIQDHDPVMTLAQLERKYVQMVLESLNGNKKEAVEFLGIGKTTLYRKLKEWE